MHYDPNHSHTLPPRLSVESSSGEPWRSTSCDSIADSARSLALGKPLSAQEARSKKHARPEDIFPLMANAHEYWTPQQPPDAKAAPPPASRGLFSRLFGSAEHQKGAEAETEPLMGEPRPSAWDAIRARVAPPPPPPGRCHCLCRRLPALSYRQRLMGFGICLGIGLMLSLTSFMSFSELLLGNPFPFACKYTLGNLLSMGASGFLVGLSKMCSDMFAPVRRVASLLYMGSLCTTLVCIFYLHNKLLTSFSMCIQLFAMVWYCFSYLPFGHTMLRRCVGSVI